MWLPAACQHALLPGGTRAFGRGDLSPESHLVPASNEEDSGYKACNLGAKLAKYVVLGTSLVSVYV